MLSTRWIIEIAVRELGREGGARPAPPAGLRTVTPPRAENRTCLINAKTGRVGGPPTNEYLHSPDTLHVSLESGVLGGENWKDAVFRVTPGDQLDRSQSQRSASRLIWWNM